MSAKALLVNVDSRFNLALRRLKTCYLAEGWEVDELDLRLPGYPHQGVKSVNGYGYDSAWISNIFDVNQGRVTVWGCPADYGGMGSKHPEKRIPA